jgi:hypothetical protein
MLEQAKCQQAQPYVRLAAAARTEQPLPPNDRALELASNPRNPATNP